MPLMGGLAGGMLLGSMMDGGMGFGGGDCASASLAFGKLTSRSEEVASMGAP